MTASSANAPTLDLVELTVDKVQIAFADGTITAEALT